VVEDMGVAEVEEPAAAGAVAAPERAGAARAVVAARERAAVAPAALP